MCIHVWCETWRTAKNQQETNKKTNKQKDNKQKKPQMFDCIIQVLILITFRNNDQSVCKVFRFKILIGQLSIDDIFDLILSSNVTKCNDSIRLVKTNFCRLHVIRHNTM